MIVYHYLNRQFGIESLLLRRLRISIVHKLKDPFEHRAFAMSDETLRQFAEVLKDMQQEGTGIICFAGNYTSPVMWSQYADNHAGLCLGFENIRDIESQRVEYVDAMDEPITLAELDISKLLVCARTKFSDWQYEDEYRARVSFDPAKGEDGNYFMPYSERMKLTHVVVGSRCTLPREALERLSGLHGLSVFKLRPSNDCFEMVRDETW